MRHVPARFLAILLAVGPIAPPLVALAQSSGLDRGIKLFEERKYAEARSDFTAFFKANPKNASAAYWIGRTYVEDSTTLGKAVDWFNKAVDLEPTSSLYHLWLGNAYGDQAQRASKFKQPFLAKKVQHEFEKAVQLDPKNMDARSGLVDFYTLAPGFMGGGDDKARAQIAEIRKLDPWQGHVQVARFVARKKDQTLAEKDFLAWIEEYPDSLAGYVNLVSTYAATKQNAKAWAVVDQYIKRKPENPYNNYFVGRTAAVLGDQLDRGVEGLRKYMTQTPGPSEQSIAAAHWRMGQIMEKKGDKVTARKEYETAVSLDPNSAAKNSLKNLK